MRLFWVFLLLLASCDPGLCQSSSARAFEVASVKLSPAETGITIGDHGGPLSPDPTHWSCEYFSLLRLLSKAYGLYEFQISGPRWLETQRFHIDAKVPAGSTYEQFREMLRDLLKERFALIAHLQSKPMKRFELSVSKSGPKLHRAVSRPAPARGTASSPSFDSDGYPKLDPPSDVPQMLTVQGRTRMFFPQMSMQDLAEELSLKLNQPVIDNTQLGGLYDIELYWSSDDPGPSLSQALKEQMGLRLQLKKGNVEILVVDRMEKLPTGN